MSTFTSTPSRLLLVSACSNSLASEALRPPDRLEHVPEKRIALVVVSYLVVGGEHRPSGVEDHSRQGLAPVVHDGQGGGGAGMAAVKCVQSLLRFAVHLELLPEDALTVVVPAEQQVEHERHDDGKQQERHDPDEHRLRPFLLHEDDGEDDDDHVDEGERQRQAEEVVDAADQDPEQVRHWGCPRTRMVITVSIGPHPQMSGTREPARTQSIGAPRPSFFRPQRI